MTIKLNHQRILIAKTTHLGDVVITLPLAARLKQQSPDCTVMFLTQARTAAVVGRCLDVDSVHTEPEDFDDLVALLASLQVDVFIQVNTSKRLAKAAKAAGIAVRIGSLFRLYNWWLCTHCVAISRGHSQLNKRLLDMQYLRPFGLGEASLEQISTSYQFASQDPAPLIQRLGLAMHKRRILVHPCLITAKSHQWPLVAYQALMAAFDPKDYQWIITGTAADRTYLAPLLANNNANVDCVNTVGHLTLDELITLMMISDGLIASNTGPLHLAAALGIPVVGFYQSNPAVYRRWAAVGRSVTLLHSDVACLGDKHGKACLCVQAISPEQVKQAIISWFAER